MLGIGGVAAATLPEDKKDEVSEGKEQLVDDITVDEV